MFCPFCKGEFRRGILRCSDCNFPLLGHIPQNASDESFMVLLWNGESLPFLETVCAELDKAGIPVATPRVEVLLRANRYHLKHLKTFPYVIGVHKRDFAKARLILERIAQEFPLITLLPADAYPEPFDEDTSTDQHTPEIGALDATTTIYSSTDTRALEFVQLSLSGLDIPFRKIFQRDGTCEIQVRHENEGTARNLIEEIERGTSSYPKVTHLENDYLQDDGPESYFLAWFLPAVYFIVLLSFGIVGPYLGTSNNRDFIGMVLSGQSLALLGGLWMIYQALRYEVRPARYCAAAILPFTFVWYYIERYRLREGLQRLPVSLRMQIQNRPPA